MSWTKHFKPVNSVLPTQDRTVNSTFTSTSKYNNWLPEVYAGPPDRLQRYSVYDQMSLDHEISAALDTLADFGTSPDEVTQLPLIIKYRDNPTPTETQVLDKSLVQWIKLNDFTKRLWRIFRSTLVYGDQFFLRDPETFKLFWVDPAKVEKVIVNESEGKAIESYFIKDIDLNIKDLVATNQLNKSSSASYGNNSIVFSPPSQGNINYISGGFGSSGSAAYQNGGAVAVDAEHVIHVSLTDGMSSAWPFGASVLEQIYKVYKQKELLEDAILIYRIHRAPERRMFFIDVGTMPPNKAQQYLERVKYEVNQKRVPSRTGGGASVTDSMYNPLSTLEDYYFAVTESGRGSKIEVLPGGDNLGCFALDTKIKLLDSRELSIAEIESEIKDGKELWTYSCHPVTGDIAPGLISWAGKTKSNANVLKITLDNGETITCTPDHKFPILGRGFVEAKDLGIGQSLIPIYTKTEEISSTKKLQYEKIFNPSTNAWEFTHRVVLDFLKSKGLKHETVFDSTFADSDKDVRHHIDCNRYNNAPSNLTWMNWNDHQLYHTSIGFDAESQQLGSLAARERMLWLKEHDKNQYDAIIQSQIDGRKAWRDTLSEVEKGKIRKSISAGLQHYIDNLSDADKAARDAISVSNLTAADGRLQYLLNNDEEFSQFFKEQVSAGIHQSKIDNPEKWVQRSKSITEANLRRWKLDGYYDKVFESQKIKYDIVLLELFTELYLQNVRITRTDFANVCNNNSEFMHYFKHINKVVHTNTDVDTFEERKINDLLACFNMTWESFRITHTSIINDALLQQLKQIYNESYSQDEFVSVVSQQIPEITSRHLLLKVLNDRGIDTFKMFREFSKHTNHRVLSVEYLDEKIDVGTLTIDIDEKYHDYHTYALAAGVFVKNSIDDLKYFNNKMLRALGVPSSYLPTGPDDGTAGMSDGKVGTAYIQEFRFSKVVTRYQQQIIGTIDKEFKLFLKNRGLTIDNSLFELAFTPAQSFSEYRQLELDSARINIFSALADVPYVSKRYILKRYLGWSPSEINENEKMWKEERSRLTKSFDQDQPMGAGGAGGVGMPGGGGGSAPAGLSDVGITSSGIDSMAPEDMDDTDDSNDMPDDDTSVSDDEVNNFGD